MPETFVVGRDGTILYKMVGPVTPANLDSVLKVEIEKALGGAAVILRSAKRVEGHAVQAAPSRE